ncbi:MAG: hypothetical protein LBU46_08510, partial [Candidatus Accumulibacter sp.]|nr:hypothetical protein [Accumulibacter sp.]
LYSLGVVAIVAIGFAFSLGGGFIAAAIGGEEAAAGLPWWLVGLVVALPAVPLFMSAWFAPALVALYDLAAFEAMKLSFRGCMRNLLPFLIYGLAFIVLAVLASLPLLLGWLLLMPSMVCSVYASYRDIFTGES